MAVESEMGTVDGSEQPQRRHKIPVPTNYRSATKILRQVVEERGNVKSLILGDKHLRKGKGLAMMDLILVNLKQIEDILARTKLLEKEPRLNPWLAKVLVAELVFGRGELTGESRPVQCVRSYRDVLQEALGKSDVPPPKLSNFKGNCRVSPVLRGVFLFSSFPGGRVLVARNGKEKQKYISL